MIMRVSGDLAHVRRGARLDRYSMATILYRETRAAKGLLDRRTRDGHGKVDIPFIMRYAHLKNQPQDAVNAKI
jgi:hypothetical protein